MKMYVLGICCLLAGLMLSSCAPGQAFGPTAIPTATSTAVPTDTPAPTQTPTPVPTTTPTPTPTSSPTPVPEVGKPLTGEKWEITVLEVVRRERIVTGYSLFTPKKGYMLVDVALKAKNLDASNNPSILASQVFLVDEMGNRWAPAFWGDLPAVSGKEIDPFSVGIYAVYQAGMLNPDEITVENESYLRFIYPMLESSLGETVGLRFHDLPVVPFSINE